MGSRGLVILRLGSWKSGGCRLRGLQRMQWVICNGIGGAFATVPIPPDNSCQWVPQQALGYVSNSSETLDLEPRQIPRLAAELDTDQPDRLV